MQNRRSLIRAHEAGSTMAMLPARVLLALGILRHI